MKWLNGAQGDQIGRIFAHSAILFLVGDFLLWARKKIQESARNLGYLFNGKSEVIMWTK
jgi:hypothetical protein